MNKEHVELFLKEFLGARATKEEKETFLFLLKAKEMYALDFINCWLALNKLEIIPEDSFNAMKEHVKILTSTKKGSK